ncbi:Uncharacterised protein [Salmonella enterica subsp. enterica serovar Typhimurium str. DT104]|nr:Uncharacterised protein [Salmonella enterica subsp. enterica serovar Typhimurium str. DT104]CQP88425.1 Uncharacterised protein [Salmonella enterica subsp. enterica serovar Typhimurium str. DT104]
MDFVKVAVGAGHHRQLVADTFGRLVNIGDIGEGVKTQGLPVQVHPAHIFAQGLVPVPHVKHHCKAAGIQHAADKRLYQPGLARPGSSADRHVVVGVVHSPEENINKGQLVTVGRSQQPGGRQRVIRHQGHQVGHIEALRPLHHTGFLQLLKQSLPGHKGQAGQEITHVVKARRNQLKTVFTETVQDILLRFQRRFLVVAAERRDIEKVGHHRGLVRRQALAQVSPLLRFLLHGREPFGVGGLRLLLQIHVLQVRFAVGLHLVFHHQGQRQNERTGDGQLRVQQIAVIIRRVPQEGDFRVTGQMKTHDARGAVFPVIAQSQRQVILPDLQVKGVVHALVIQVGIRVQPAPGRMDGFRIVINHLPDNINKCLRINGLCADVCPLQGSPDNLHQVFHLQDIGPAFFSGGRAV